MVFRNFLYLAIAAFFPACATIDRGLTDHIRVDTVPQGAFVEAHYFSRESYRDPFQSETVTCKATPCALPVPRKEIAKVKIEKPGFQSVEYIASPSSLKGGVGMDLSTTATSTGVSAYFGYATAQFLEFSFLSTSSGISGASAASIGTGVGLGLAGASLLVDAGSGANKNLFPNPMIIALSETPHAEIDPLVQDFRQVQTAYSQVIEICQTVRAARNARSGPCYEAQRRFRSTYNDLRDKSLERDREIQETIKHGNSKTQESTP